MLSRALAWILPAFAAVAACSGGTSTIGNGASSGSSGEEESSSGNGSSSSSGNGSSSSSGNGSSSGASSGDPPQATKSGTITIMSTHYKVGQTPIEMGSATGTFYQLPPATGAAGASPCTITKEGACTVTACTFGSTPTDAGAPSIQYTHAGPVKVSGVLVNNGTMTLTPGAYGYQTVSGNAAFFNGGENVRLVAPGNPSGAPAFDVALVAPTSPNVTAPTFNAQSQVVVANGQSLGLAWQNGGSGEVVAQIASGTQQKSAIARCAFPGGAGNGTIPAAAIKTVYGAGAQTSFFVSAEGNKVLTPDGWTITVALQAYGLRATANGPSIASGLLVVQ